MANVLVEETRDGLIGISAKFKAQMLLDNFGNNALVINELDIAMAQLSIFLAIDLHRPDVEWTRADVAPTPTILLPNILPDTFFLFLINNYLII